MKMNVIYTAFVRIQTKEGTFAALVSDLDRIRALGTDAVCLTPIFRTVPEYQWDLQPNPYDVLDQREISGEYGSMEDFQNLVEEIHRRGMKCILEVVTASLSKASPLFKEHPEYFVYEKPEQGRFPMERLLDRFHVTYDEFVAETNLTEEEITSLLLKVPVFLDAMDIEEITIPVAGSYGSMKGMGNRSLFAVDFQKNTEILHEMLYGTKEDEG